MYPSQFPDKNAASSSSSINKSSAYPLLNDRYQFSFLDTTKPREERDFKEIYPDLDEQAQLKVFVLDESQDTDDCETHPLGDEAATPAYGKRPVSELKKPQFVRKGKQPFKTANIRFNKVFTDYGFQDPIRPALISNTYIRPFSLHPNETIQSKIAKKRKQVEYDMDEQDVLYLQHRNNNPQNVIKLRPEIFEIFITILENEWSKLEFQMNNDHSASHSNINNNGLLTLDEESSEDKYGNDDGIVQGSFSAEQKCAVCNDSDCDNSNAIVFCDGCDIAVHQECYGVAFIPEGQWLCRKCMINTNNKRIECCFCPSTTGAFKQLDNSLWGHVICALWINELYFANPIYMEPIEGIDLIPKNRWRLSCYICKQRRGACVQCCNRNCFQAYHVTCAKRAGIYMNMTKGLQGAISNKLTLKSYCDKHAPPYWDQRHAMQGINKTRAYYRDLKILHEQNDKLTNRQKTANRLNSFKWKTENNTPIPPKHFSDVLFQTALSLKLEDSTSNDFPISSFTNTTSPFASATNGHHDDAHKPRNLSILRDLGIKPHRSRESIWQELREICNDICKYWCLKREHKNGAPLIRKNNNLISMSSILYGNNEDQEEINEKLLFSDIILQDLERLINLSVEHVDYQFLQNQSIILQSDMVDATYFPLKKIMEIVVLEINAKADPHRILLNYKFKTTTGVNPGESTSDAQSLAIVKNKVTNHEYSTLSQLTQDVNSFNSQVMLENKPNTQIAKIMKKWYREYSLRLPHLLAIEAKISQEFSIGTVSKPNNTIKVPFVDIDGLNIEFQSRDTKEILQDLSEVESESESGSDKAVKRHKFSAEDNDRLFKRFLDGETS